jgi:hypothetical protein
MIFQLILGLILMGITIFEISINIPFKLNRGWDKQTTPYFFKWVFIAFVSVYLIVSCLK